MQFLIIGHITRDITPNGYTLGGTTSYAGIAAQRLGADVTILTRAHRDDARHPSLSGIKVVNLPSNYTSTFENVYHNDIRTQHLRAVAGPIMAGDVPESVTNADITLLGPLTQEVDPAMIPLMKGMLASTPQGWMREWDGKGQVKAIPWYSAGRVLPHLDAIIFSDADLIGDLSVLPKIIDAVPIVAITKAAGGCVLYVNGKGRRIPARSAREVDPTGAGDTFAAAFLIHLYEHQDPVQAAYFANVTASMGVEGPGLQGIPYREQIEDYIKAHPLP